MANRSGIGFIPLVFGYVTYAAVTAQRPVLFSEAPRIASGGRRGSVLGGTGIAISRKAKPDDALFDHLRWLMSPEIQSGFIPGHAGQPSARTAWHDPAVNAGSHDFYAATRETAESAWVRPRFDGYIAFQNKASAIIRQNLPDTTSAPETLRQIRSLWHAANTAARGPISN